MKLKRKKAAGEYLAYLTVKYDVHPDIIFCSLLSAQEVGKAKCGPLLVEYRGKIDDNMYFLFKDGSDVVAQFPISEELLEKQGNPIRNFMDADMVQSYKPEETQEPIYSQICDLNAKSTRVNLKAKVRKVSKPQYVNTQYGNRVPMAKALLKDETGEINLCLWREQIDTVRAGDYIEIQNATVKKFVNKNQLFIGNKGTIKIIQNIKADLNPEFFEQAKVRTK